MSRLLAAALLLCLAASAAAAPPARIDAQYEIYKAGIRIVTMTETFTRKDDRYALESVSNAVGLLALIKAETIRATSVGSITPQGLRPEHYTSMRKVDNDRNTRADFDWGKHQVTLAYRGGVHVEPLVAGTQDRLSAMYQLMFLPLPEMHELKLFMYNNGTQVDDYTYEVTGKATVSVPLGTFPALYLATRPEKNGKRTEIWVDAEHHFPYKLVVTDRDGGKFTQVLTAVKFTQ
jgi:Protein of unknown function (DUF3108)